MTRDQFDAYLAELLNDKTLDANDNHYEFRAYLLETLDTNFPGWDACPATTQS